MAGAECVLACLGVGGVGRAEMPLPAFAVVARDDDPPGSKASLALGRSVARLLLHGCEVVDHGARRNAPPRRARTSPICRGWMLALARQFLDTAKGVADRLDEAEREALLEEVSKAAPDAYERNRKAIATALHWRTGPLDEERSRRRQARAREPDPVTRVVELEPWPQPVPDIGAVLDAAVDEVQRFLVAPDGDLSRHDGALGRALRISCTAKSSGSASRRGSPSRVPIKRCGKSTALKCTYLMAHNARMAALDHALVAVSRRRRLQTSRSWSTRATTSSRPPAPSCSPSSIPAPTG